jgi:hypothetical protein
MVFHTQETTEMNSKKSSLLTLVLAIGGMLGLVPYTAPAQSQSVKATTATRFRWSGECQIKCEDGRCENYCATGLVVGVDAGDAKIKAEAELRSQASRRGTVVEGTIRVTVTVDFAEQAKTASDETVVMASSVILLQSTLSNANSYHAACAHPSHGFSGWFGLPRSTLAEAVQDARDHERRNPGHDADAF